MRDVGIVDSFEQEARIIEGKSVNITGESFVYFIEKKSSIRRVLGEGKFRVRVLFASQSIYRSHFFGLIRWKDTEE